MASSCLKHLIGFLFGSLLILLCSQILFFKPLESVLHDHVFLLNLLEIVMVIKHEDTIVVDSSFASESGQLHSTNHLVYKRATVIQATRLHDFGLVRQLINCSEVLRALYAICLFILLMHVVHAIPIVITVLLDLSH
jgi:hypothetical protein